MPSLIVLGSCGLHIVNGTYKTGQQQTNWELEKNMKAVHGIFKNPPQENEILLQMILK